MSKVDKCNDARNPNHARPKCGQMCLPIILKQSCLFLLLITKDTCLRENSSKLL